MIRELEFSYSVASLAAPGVIPIDLPLPDCDILALRVYLGAAMDGGDATFNFTKNGVNMFSGGDRLTIADTESGVIKSSLLIANVYGDSIRLQLEEISGGTVTVPIMVFVTIDDGLSLDSLYVALTGNQTVAGVKTFSSSPIIPTQTPASAGAAGTVGTIAWDANYIYICTATDTWKRVAISTW